MLSVIPIPNITRPNRNGIEDLNSEKKPGKKKLNTKKQEIRIIKLDRYNQTPKN